MEHLPTRLTSVRVRDFSDPLVCKGETNRTGLRLLHVPDQPSLAQLIECLKASERVESSY